MGRLVFIILFYAFPICALGLEQHCMITAFDAHHIMGTSGAAEYEITGTIHFEHSMDDFNKAGAKEEQEYVLVIKFKDAGKLITTHVGFERQFADEDGSFYLQKTQRLTMANVNDYDFKFSIPVAVLNLAEGEHILTPLISVTDKQTQHSVLRKEKIAPVTIKILPTSKIRLWVKHILVDSLDADGNLWDYFLFNPIDGNPDIVWSLKYAGRTYFASKMLLNTFEYTDKDQRETYTLTISKGDTISIEVKDVDDLTPDDIIGTVLVAPSDPKHQNDATITTKAGQIKSLQYVITELP